MGRWIDQRVQDVRGRWKCEVTNWGDEEVREFKRWEGERGRWRGEVEEQFHILVYTSRNKSDMAVFGEA